MIKFYDSLSELRNHAISLGITSEGPDSRAFGAGKSYPASFCGNESLSEVLRKLDVGDSKLVPAAQKLMDELEQNIEVKKRVWESAPSGAFPCVPDYCMGLPTSMRRRQIVQDDSAPITILVCTSSSAGIPATALARRGCAILALTMSLTASRPVNLRVVATGDGKEGETVLVTKINTTPLDLASACYALTSAGFDRRIHHYTAQKLNNFTGYWPKGYVYSAGDNNPYLKELPTRLGFNPEDCLLIAPSYLTDTLIVDPVAWIKEQLKRFRAVTNE